MKLVIDINKDIIIEKLQSAIINAITFVYGWLITDGEILGYILAIFHMMISFAVIVMIFLSHTFYPNFYFQLITFGLVFVIWLHHVLLNVCISIVAEKNLTKSISPFSELLYTLLKSYNISIDDFTRYFIVAETTGVFCFAMEILSRCFYYILTFLKH